MHFNHLFVKLGVTPQRGCYCSANEEAKKVGPFGNKDWTPNGWAVEAASRFGLISSCTTIAAVMVWGLRVRF